MKTDRSVLSVALMALLGPVATAPVHADDQSASVVASRFKEMYPRTTFTEVRKAPVEGLYEVVMGQNVAYTDQSGRFFIFGSMWDMKQQADVTPRPRPVERRVTFPTQQLGQAIKTVKGDGSRTLAIFSDPDCQYCRTLEKELEQLDNVTVYTFMYPLAAIHPQAPGKAVSVWCSADRAKAWQQTVVEGRPVQTAPCENPVEANLALGSQLGVTGTPTLIAGDGRVLTGAAPAARLDAWLNTPSEQKQ